MVKKKRYCRYPIDADGYGRKTSKICGLPIWNKNSPNYTSGKYCKKHRTNESKAFIKRLIRKGWEYWENDEQWYKLVKPEHETRIGTINVGSHIRDDLESEAEFIHRHKNDVLSGKTVGAYASDGLKDDNFSTIHKTTDRERLLGVDDSGGDLAFTEDETGYLEFERKADGFQIVDRVEYSGNKTWEMNDDGEWQSVEETIKQKDERKDKYKNWKYW